MKTIQPNDNPMNYVPVGANRIRPNITIRTNPNSHQMNSPKSNSAQSNSTQKYFPNENRANAIRPNGVIPNWISILRIRNRANAIRPNQIHQKFSIALLRQQIQFFGYKWKGEMSKDVSAMANVNGGTIIYGVKESPHIKVQCRHNFQNKGEEIPFFKKITLSLPKGDLAVEIMRFWLLAND